MGGFTIKIKTEADQHIVNVFTEGTSIKELKSKISELTNVREAELQLFFSFPRKPLDLTRHDATLKECGVNSGETIIVEQKALNTKSDSPNVDSDEYIARVIQEQDNLDEQHGVLMKVVVPADNSCLFTSIGYALSGKIDTECGGFMRKIIAEEVAGDLDTYTEAFLGKPNKEYSKWIQQPETWGGAIEVSILSKFYGIEIAVVDIENAIINRFGEDRSYGMRIFLLFNGIHYDPLHMESFVGKPPRTVFPIEEQGVFQQAEQLALEAKASRQFTNVEKFSLKCYHCESVFVGQVEAQEHAKLTGHAKFDEV